MADIRINALATTAASTASDDFVAVDGSANGTRKLNAFSPTFGGNLTVSGAANVGNLLTVTGSGTETGVATAKVGASALGGIPRVNLINATNAVNGKYGDVINTAASGNGAFQFRFIDDAITAATAVLSITGRQGATDSFVTAPGTGAHTFGTTNTVTMTNGVLATTGAGTIGGNLTVSGTTGVTATDLILGTSGPSVKSSLSARAPRQGLVFDGTAGASATLASAIGTSSVTIDVVATVPSSAPAAAYGVFSIGVNGSANALSAYFNNDGTLLLILVGATGSDYRYVKTSRNIISALGGKTARITFVRDSENSTKYIYINGVAEALQADVTAGTPPAWSGSVTSTTYYIGKLTSTLYPYLGSFGPINTYNRALSASEVVALYEAGAPAGADYNNASNTSLVTGDNSTFASDTGYWTKGNGATISGGKANLTGGANSNIYRAGLTVAGKRYRMTVTVDAADSVAYISDGNVTTLVTGTAAGFGTTGTKTFEFTVPSTSSTGIQIISTSGTLVLDNLLLVPLGLLLAPDAAQAGGGLVWYDTSGNAANITLPASGVSWNVPTSGKVATGWAFGGDVGIGTTTPGKRLEVNKNLATNTVGAGEVVRLISDDGNNVGRITEIGFGVGPTGATYAPVTLGTAVTTATGFNKKDFYIATRDATTDSAPSERLRLFANGNLFIGASPVDSGNGKLQLATHTTSAGGIGFGTDVSLFRSAPGVLRLASTSNYSHEIVNTAGTGAATTSYSNTGGYLFVGIDSSSGGALGGGAYAGVISRDGAYSLVLRTNSTTALTLDSSQNATFAGKITAGTWADVVSARLGVATSANSYTATIANNASSGGAYALRLHTTGTASSDYIVVGSSGASAGSIRFLADGAGNFVVNNAAIATTATDGFLYVSTCAGTPTGTPTSYTGRAPIVVDTTNNKLYFYSGGAWRDAGP